METSGFMTDPQIQEAINNHEIIIYPFNKKNLTPVGYNFSYSRFIVSLNKKNFVDLKEDKEKGERYFVLKSNESVLILTNETLAVSKNIGGTFHSKVSVVALGIGHVSTTLDPGWQGQLLVPMNNPTKQNIKVVIERRDTTLKDSEYKLETFITLVFFSSAIGTNQDVTRHKPARIDILRDIIISGRSNRKRDKLIKAIRVLSSYYDSKKDLIDLSTNYLRKKNIDGYIEQQEDLHRKLNIEYPLIEQAAHDLRITDKQKFVFITTVNFITLVVLSVCSYVIQGEVAPDVMKLIITILIPFSIFFLNNIKDRYI